ncbi:MAG: trehalose-phosphatase [Janthinobacterium lividum]
MPLGLPPPGSTALLLDMDGTLLDIAPTPDAVRVPDGLADTLQRLRSHLGGALAIVTGRPIEQIDALLPGIPYAIAGEHGGAIRHAPGTPVVRAILPDPPVEWIMEAARLVESHPGTLLEQKQRGFVFHYRAVPELGPLLREAALALIAPEADRFGLMEASMAWEVRPRGVDKASAVEALMQDTPFAGRQPVFIGDDVTDEDGMRAARAVGGAGLRVPDVFGGPAGVRAWLARCADALDAGAAEWPGAV